MFHNIFFLVIGINFIVVGLVALIAGIVTLFKKDDTVKRQTSIMYIVAGIAAVYFGVILSRN